VPNPKHNPNPNLNPNEFYGVYLGTTRPEDEWAGNELTWVRVDCHLNYKHRLNVFWFWQHLQHVLVSILTYCRWGECRCSTVCLSMNCASDDRNCQGSALTSCLPCHIRVHAEPLGSTWQNISTISHRLSSVVDAFCRCKLINIVQYTLIQPDSLPEDPDCNCNY